MPTLCIMPIGTIHVGIYTRNYPETHHILVRWQPKAQSQLHPSQGMEHDSIKLSPKFRLYRRAILEIMIVLGTDINSTLPRGAGIQFLLLHDSRQFNVDILSSTQIRMSNKLLYQDEVLLKSHLCWHLIGTETNLFTCGI